MINFRLFKRFFLHLNGRKHGRRRSRVKRLRIDGFPNKSLRKRRITLVLKKKKNQIIFVNQKLDTEENVFFFLPSLLR